ncbi:hypothetical protein D3C76_683210 [compost metagenome]|jgi:DNA-binding MurR/RpiR family transcriptional regulator
MILPEDWSNFRGQVEAWRGGNENAAYLLAAITNQDVLLAISLPRYSLDTLQLARFASEPL